MFGYIKINKMDLTFREYEHYKSYYCGLCKTLKKEYGEISRLSLNFDITFLILLLSAIYKPKSNISEEICIANPLKKKKILTNEITEYAASMNILLTYQKLIDNVLDEGGVINKSAEFMYRSKYKIAEEKYPEKAQKIKEELEKLHELEKIQNATLDDVSNTFGNIMAEIFAYKDDEYQEKLRIVGFNIGKYIYILDAFEDLEEDIEKNRYNPLKNFYNNLENELYKDEKGCSKEIVVDEQKKIIKKKLAQRIDRIITLTLGILSNTIESIEIEFNKPIINNIIYSGVYLRYKEILRK